MSKTKIFLNMCNDYYQQYRKLPNEIINTFSRFVFKDDLPETEKLSDDWIRNRATSALKQVKNEDDVSLWDAAPDRDGYYKITDTESAYHLKSSINMVDSSIKGCKKKKDLLQLRLDQVRFYFDELGNIIDVKSPSQLVSNDN